MKSRFTSVAATAFLASGMLFAYTPGMLPASTSDATESSVVSQASTSEMLPGVASTQETANAGLTTSGMLPGVSAHSNELGSASPNSSVLPGALTATPTIVSHL